MHTAVTNEQIQHYRQAGYVRVEQFLSPAEVEELKAAVFDAAVVMDRKAIAADEKGFRAYFESYYGQVFTQKVNLWRTNATVKKYMHHPELGKMICRLGGVPGYRIWHDQVLIKESFANPTAFHLDDPFWSFSSQDAISIWIALEDATLENGCMWFQPGTQKMGRFEHTPIGENLGHLFKMYPEMAQVDPVPVPMKAGDCSFHNGMLSHGAGPNMTRKRRIAMTAGYMPEGSTFNGNANVLPRDYLQTLKVGDVLENDDWNPVVGRIE